MAISWSPHGFGLPRSSQAVRRARRRASQGLLMMATLRQWCHVSARSQAAVVGQSGPWCCWTVFSARRWVNIMDSCSRLVMLPYLRRTSLHEEMLASRGLFRAAAPARRALNASGVRLYHENIVDHYENPRNVGSLDKNDPNVGTVRTPGLYEQGLLFRRLTREDLPSLPALLPRAWSARPRAAT